MKSLRIIYWIITGLLCLFMLVAAGMYIVHYQTVTAIFTHLEYPPYLVYPLAAAKILGVIAILTKKSKTLKEWAYAGFFFDFILALAAHANAGESVLAPVIALVLLVASYALDRRIYG